MPTPKRVVITGLGAIAPGGIGKDAFWKTLIEGRSTIGPITLFDASSHKCRIAGEVRDFQITDFCTPKTNVKRLARHTQLALAGTVLALRDASIDAREIEHAGPVRITLGVSTSAMEVIEDGMQRLMSHGPRRVPSHALSSCQPQQAASVVRHELGFAADARTMSSACAAGINAIASAAQEIRYGRMELAIAGGADAPVGALTFAAMEKAGLLSTANARPEKASRPFDRDADSGVVSEGSGVVVLESLEHALARGATMYAEVEGYAASADTDAAVSLSGLATAIRMALANASRLPDTVDLICAHGPGHPVMDLNETNVLKEVFEARAFRIPVTSIKGVIGNPLAAAGPLQVIAAACVFRDNLVPPIANLENPAPGCDLDFVAMEPRMNKVNCILVNSHGLGGVNGSMVLTRVGDRR